MDEAIYMISPDDAPLINGLNSDGLQILPVLPVDEKSFKWMDEERLTPETLLGAAVTTAFTTLLCQSGQRTRFSTGDLLTVESVTTQQEVMLVTSYGSTADTLVVTRAITGTAGSYASADKGVGLGQYLVEGSDPELARTVDRSERENFTQIFGPTQMSMSRTEMNRRKFGVANEFTHQLQNRLIEMTIHRDRAFLLGRKKEDTTNKKRATGGIVEWITTEVNSALTEFNVTNIETMMTGCYDNGGVPDIITANPKALGDLNELTDTGRTRVTFEDVRRGRTPVRFVETEFGTVTIVRNRYCPTYLAVGWCREQATRRVFDPVIMKRLAVTGDSEDTMIVCEEGLEFKGEAHAFAMKALDY